RSVQEVEGMAAALTEEDNRVLGRKTVKRSPVPFPGIENTLSDGSVYKGALGDGRHYLGQSLRQLLPGWLLALKPQVRTLRSGRVWGMDVGIIETRNHQTAAHINLASTGTGKTRDLLVGAYRNDAVPLNRKRLGKRMIFRCGEHPPVRKDEV